MTIDLRLFIVGAPRSGTTLVQSLLAAHEQLTSFTESHFFSRHFRQPFSVPLLAHNPNTRVRAFLEENQEQVAAPRFMPLLARPATRTFLTLLDDITARRGKSGWIEKTPRHLHYIPLIESVSPNVRFLHVLREGVEVVASLYKASKNWPQAYDLETCVQRWNEDVALSLQRIQASGDFFIAYEELTADPESALRRLLGELALDWDPGLMDRYAQASDRLIAPEESWKAGIGRGIRRSATSEQILSEKQLAFVRRKLRQDLYEQILEGRI